MNRKQKVALWAGIAVFVLMGLFPPWGRVKHSISPEIISCGYCFVGTPPAAGEFDKGYRVDSQRLLIQWAMVAAVTGGAIVTLKGRKTGARESTRQEGKEPQSEAKQERKRKPPWRFWVLLASAVLTTVTALVFWVVLPTLLLVLSEANNLPWWDPLGLFARPAPAPDDGAAG